MLPYMKKLYKTLETKQVTIIPEYYQVFSMTLSVPGALLPDPVSSPGDTYRIQSVPGNAPVF